MEHRGVWKETLATSTILGVIVDVWIILARGKFSSRYSTKRVETAWVYEFRKDNNRDKESCARSLRVDMGVDDVLLSRIPLAFYEDQQSRNIYYNARPAFTFIDFIQRWPLTGRIGKVTNSCIRTAIPLLSFSRYRTGQSKTLIDLIRKSSCQAAESCPALTGFITYRCENYRKLNLHDRQRRNARRGIRQIQCSFQNIFKMISFTRELAAKNCDGVMR